MTTTGLLANRSVMFKLVIHNDRLVFSSQDHDQAPVIRCHTIHSRAQAGSSRAHGPVFEAEVSFHDIPPLRQRSLLLDEPKAPETFVPLPLSPPSSEAVDGSREMEREIEVKGMWDPAPGGSATRVRGLGAEGFLLIQV
jgi:hypothetical protein